MPEEAENPTIQEAFESASSSLQSSNAPQEAPQGEQPAEVPTEEASAQAEAPAETVEAEAESPEETPLDKVDPATLPPELQRVYKDLQKGFTQGRQKDREEVNTLKRELQELRAKLNPAPEDDPNLSPEERIEQIAEKVVTQKKLEDFRETALKEYNQLDPRLDSSNEESFDPIMDAVIGSKLDALLDQHVQEHGSELGFDYKSYGKDLVKEWDQYLSTHTQRYLAKQKDMAKKQETSIQRMNPKASISDTKPSGTMSLEAAMAAAWNKLG